MTPKSVTPVGNWQGDEGSACAETQDYNDKFPRRRLAPKCYTIGWISALSEEQGIAQEMLDEIHESPSRQEHDINTYTLGNIGPHNIVQACLPSNKYGKINCASVASHMVRTFQSIQIFLMVGIGGGCPSDEDGFDLRLGDIVVGDKVIEYDFGKVYKDGRIETTADPITLRSEVGTSVSKMRGNQEAPSRSIHRILRQLGRKKEWMASFCNKENLEDHLYIDTYEHKEAAKTCDECDDSKRIKLRADRPNSSRPKIHYGTIASADKVMKDAIQRDKIAKQFKAMCFEMEAAGLPDHTASLVIRGICDYADSHKNKEWQKYAAGVAAAYARVFLLEAFAPKEIDDPSTSEASESVFTCSACANPLNMNRRREPLSRQSPEIYALLVIRAN